MAKKRTLSPTERAYSAQVKRIKNFIRRAGKRGYIFNENTLPTKPKRITQASVRRLQRLTPQQLYKKAQYSGQLSEGKTVSAQTGLQLEKHARIAKAKETRYKHLLEKHLENQRAIREINQSIKDSEKHRQEFELRRAKRRQLREQNPEEYKQYKTEFYYDETELSFEEWLEQHKHEIEESGLYEPEPEEPEIVELAAGNDVDPETGEILPPENNGWSNEELKMFDTIHVPEHETADTSFYTRTVIENFYKRLEKYTNSDATDIMKNWIKSCIANTSENDVANMLQRGAEAGLVINGAVMYNSTYLYTYLTGMMEYLDLPKGFKDDIIDSVEIDDDYGIY